MGLCGDTNPDACSCKLGFERCATCAQARPRILVMQLATPNLWDSFCQCAKQECSVGPCGRSGTKFNQPSRTLLCVLKTLLQGAKSPTHGRAGYGSLQQSGALSQMPRRTVPIMSGRIFEGWRFGLKVGVGWSIEPYTFPSKHNFFSLCASSALWVVQAMSMSTSTSLRLRLDLRLCLCL